MTDYETLVGYFDKMPYFPHLVVFVDFGINAVYFDDDGYLHTMCELTQAEAKQEFLQYLKATNKWFMYHYIPSIRPICCLVTTKVGHRLYGAVALAKEEDIIMLRKSIAGTIRI